MKPLAVFVLGGAPRTKKNHGRRVWRKKREWARARPLHVDSLAHRKWFSAALPQARVVRARMGWRTVFTPVYVRAKFHCDGKTMGDLVGYMQALGDLLQAAGFIDDDRLIVSWDGTRAIRAVDDPRIEVELAVADPGMRCRAGSDGECFWKECPQEREGEPAASGRHCPLDVRDEADEEE